VETIKVLVVDDHTLFRRGIADVLSSQDDLELIGEAVDGLEGIEKATDRDIAGQIIQFMERNAKKGKTRTKGSRG